MPFAPHNPLKDREIIQELLAGIHENDEPTSSGRERMELRQREAITAAGAAEAQAKLDELEKRVEAETDIVIAAGATVEAFAQYQFEPKESWEVPLARRMKLLFDTYVILVWKQVEAAIDAGDAKVDLETEEMFKVEEEMNELREEWRRTFRAKQKRADR